MYTYIPKYRNRTQYSNFIYPFHSVIDAVYFEIFLNSVTIIYYLVARKVRAVQLLIY